MNRSTIAVWSILACGFVAAIAAPSALAANLLRREEAGVLVDRAGGGRRRP